MSNTVHRGAACIGTVTLVVVGIVVVGLVGLAVSVAPDIVPSITLNSSSANHLFEDGSFIVSLGRLSLSGCLPLHPWNGEIVTGWCMDGGNSIFGYFKRGAWVWAIGVDSPWEDFMPEPFSDAVYFVIDQCCKK